MKKKILAAAMVVFLTLLLFSGKTMAWFTDQKNVSNTLTTGTVKVHIDEPDFKPPTEWNGNSWQKPITVVNDGSIDVYVRLRLTGVWQEKQNGSFVDTSLDCSNINMAMDSSSQGDWVYNNGFYYYKKILKPKETTSNLLINVSLKTTDSKYAGKQLRIKTLSEAVQASHNAYRDEWKLSSLPDGVELWKEN